MLPLSRISVMGKNKAPRKAETPVAAGAARDGRVSGQEKGSEEGGEGMTSTGNTAFDALADAIGERL